MDDDTQRCGDPKCPNYGDELVDLYDGEGLICPSIVPKGQRIPRQITHAKVVYPPNFKPIELGPNRKSVYINPETKKRFIGSGRDGEMTDRIIDLRTGLPFGVVESETGWRNAGNGKTIHQLEEKDKWTGQMEKLQRERAKEKGHKLGYYHNKNGCTTNNIEIKVCSEGGVHIHDRDIVDVLAEKELFFIKKESLKRK